MNMEPRLNWWHKLGRDQNVRKESRRKQRKCLASGQHRSQQPRKIIGEKGKVRTRDSKKRAKLGVRVQWGEPWRRKKWNN